MKRLPRLTTRRLMLAVALSPIVIFSGKTASDVWGTKWTLIDSSFVPINSVMSKGTMTFEVTYSPWPSVAAVVATTLTLGLIWSVVERWTRRSVRP